MEIINKRLLRLMAQSEYGNMIKRERFKKKRIERYVS